MSIDISDLEDMREEFRRNNPHLTNLPPARRQTPEEIAAYKEMKRLRLIDIRKQLADIEAKKTLNQTIPPCKNTSNKRKSRLIIL